MCHCVFLTATVEAKKIKSIKIIMKKNLHLKKVKVKRKNGIVYHRFKGRSTHFNVKRRIN